ncbi:hypothetical protein CPSG_01021 [Coccidioides posadasii str. Silveira]|uniref:Uncharacterized protein n=1 Tax=Coccidioides posadasii (strain RMSCC 757 / Silveira) TaxID=443226 RepID=E9CUE0_COCPS|nr:hypothetical protein CPSG_01021 [Coccidioides posadasii str. Silveira]
MFGVVADIDVAIARISPPTTPYSVPPRFVQAHKERLPLGLVEMSLKSEVRNARSLRALGLWPRSFRTVRGKI